MSTIVVIAKAPVAGRVKTRLCPPLTPSAAAAVAGAALADTLEVVRATPATRHVIALSGALSSVPSGFHVVPQRSGGLGERLAGAFADAAAGEAADGPVLLVGMDTPQLSVGLLTDALALLADSDAVLGRSVDGGWWALGLQNVEHAATMRDVPMSSCDTAALTLAALQRRGVGVARLPVLRDVDTIADATSVAATAPVTRFARMLAEVLTGVQCPALGVGAGHPLLAPRRGDDRSGSSPRA